MERLPVELIFKIIDYLSIKNIGKFSCVTNIHNLSASGIITLIGYKKGDILCEAIKSGCINTYKIALKRGSYGWGKSLFIFAAKNGKIEFVKYFLDKGYKIDEIDHKHYTALMHAVENGHLDIVKLLINKGASIHKSDDYFPDNTLMHLARDTETIEYLISIGMSINVFNGRSLSPLSLACKRNDKEIVEYLLQSGADPNLVDKEGSKFPPMAIARKMKNPEICVLLLTYGADPNQLMVEYTL